MLLAALEFLLEADITRLRDVEVDLVIEEEIGGNGALSAVLHGRRVDEVVVLEPTGLEVFHGHRGCLEFVAELRGRGTHMGGPNGLSAITGAFEFAGAVRRLEQRILEEARTHPSFSGWERPVQINLGRIEGGEWHGSVPELCRVWCALGFLPERSVAEVKALLRKTVADLPDPWWRTHTRLEYDGIHNEGYLGDANAAVCEALRRATWRAGMPSAGPRAWNVSCDARLYARELGVPTVIYGVGSLAEAHSSHEQLPLDELESGALALIYFLTEGPVP
jgi:acetylornithine deacetylase